MTYTSLRHSPLGPVSSFPVLQPSLLSELSACAKAFIKFFNPFQQHGINREWFPYGVVVWTIPIELKGSILVFALIGLYAFASQSRFYRKLYLYQLILSSAILLLINQWTMSLFIAGMVLALIDSKKKPPPKTTTISSKILKNITLKTRLYLPSQPSHPSSISYSLNTPGWHYLTRLIPPTYLTPSGTTSWSDPKYFPLPHLHWQHPNTTLRPVSPMASNPTLASRTVISRQHLLCTLALACTCDHALEWGLSQSSGAMGWESAGHGRMGWVDGVLWLSDSWHGV